MECQVCGFSFEKGEKCPACGSESQVEFQEKNSDENHELRDSEHIAPEATLEEGATVTHFVPDSNKIVTIPFGIDQAPVTIEGGSIPYGIDHAPITD